MPKKANGTKAVVVRVGVRVTDGRRRGAIIAVSGGIVAISWEDGAIEQRPHESMSTLKTPVG